MGESFGSAAAGRWLRPIHFRFGGRGIGLLVPNPANPAGCIPIRLPVRTGCARATETGTRLRESGSGAKGKRDTGPTAISQPILLKSDTQGIEQYF